MTLTDIQRQLAPFRLAPTEYIVVGAGILAALGIRETHDVDFVVSPERFADFMALGWEGVRANDNTFLRHGILEVSTGWARSGNQPNLEDLKRDEVIIGGVPFASLARVRAWKVLHGRSKDITDVQLIDAYLASRGKI